ncbi:hypothetical protein E0L36_19235 [Streptomyces sp. AJS327]|nr:hypothetical protein [Streptomyces sp. AJS327]
MYGAGAASVGGSGAVQSGGGAGVDGGVARVRGAGVGAVSVYRVLARMWVAGWLLVWGRR